MRTRNSLSGARSSLFETLGNALALLVLIVACTSSGYSQTPDTAEGYVETGNKLFQMGAHDYAIAAYTKAIELKPDLADAYNNRAYVYTFQANRIHNTAGYDPIKEKKKLELVRSAIADYDKAIALRPQYAVFYKNRASANLLIDERKAAADLSAATKIDPSDASTWNERCRVDILVNNTYWGIETDSKNWVQEAISDCTEAIRIRPDIIEAYKNRGLANMRIRKYDLAIADYSRAIQLRPDFADAYALRAEAYRKTWEYDLAVSDATKAITLQPKEAVYYVRRGMVYLNKAGVETVDKVKPVQKIDLTLVEMALADLDKAIQLRPNYSLAYTNRAIAHCKLGNKKQSEDDRNKAIELAGRPIYLCP